MRLLARSPLLPLLLALLALLHQANPSVAATVSASAFALPSSEGAPSSAPASAASASRPSALASAVAVGADDTLHVLVRAPASVEQVAAFVRAPSGRELVAQALPVDGDEGAFLASFASSPQRLSNALGGPAEVELHVVVGGGGGVESFAWRLGSASLEKLPAVRLGKAARKAAEASEERPQIVHTFQPEARRPNALVSLVFTGAAVVPFFGLLAGLQRLGLKRSVPGGASGYMAALLFQGSIAATLAVIVVYWLSLNIFQALALLGLVSLATLVFGQRALRVHAEGRAAESAAAEGKSD